jgi:hypothetical protein
MHVVTLMVGREQVKKITQYGPLPEIRIPVVDYITLTLSVALLIAGVLQIAGLRVAAPAALVAATGLWLYYIPGIWDEITGDFWFTRLLGHSHGITGQMLTYQISTMIVAGILTYVRWRSRSAHAWILAGKQASN